MEKPRSILKQDISPFKQAAYVIAAIVVLNLLVFIGEKSGMNLGETIHWEISLTLLLFFALMNAVYFLNAEEKGKYWSYSISSYIVVAAISIFISNFMSGFGINDSGSLKWIYFIFSFCYLLFISIIGAMRRIVEIAIKQDEALRGEQK
ncbi:hypothetical protein [Portibacter lacus]|uniref:Uncharacterized protein n=1 Tax=Portibacter lacus TaxID=1099794 RepID=A0AA37WEP2_9BACT|nr:hypothetical protein [Portibacter lacus]GLR16305.1 hypothetical protein GCM10007940_09200 [Portibacter lacus]